MERKEKIPTYKGTILDIGSGYGLVMEALAKAYKDYHIIGLEPAKRNYRLAVNVINGLPNATVVNATVQGWETKDYIDQALLIFPDFRDIKTEGRAIAEKVYELLKPGAEFFIITHIPYAGVYADIAILDEFISILKMAGFSVKKQEVPFDKIPKEIKVSTIYQWYDSPQYRKLKENFSDELTIIRATKGLLPLATERRVF